MSITTIRARGLVLVAAAWLAGCTATPPTRYYSLADAAPAGSAATTTGAGTFIELAPIAMPERFARPQLVVRQQAASEGPQVEVLEQHRWSSSFDNELRDALASGIAQRLGAVDASKSGRPRGQPVVRIAVQLRQLDAVQGSGVDAGFSWTVRRTEESLAVGCQLFVSQPATGGSIDELARATQRATAQLADAIARSVKALQGSASDSCPA